MTSPNLITIRVDAALLGECLRDQLKAKGGSSFVHSRAGNQAQKLPSKKGSLKSAQISQLDVRRSSLW